MKEHNKKGAFRSFGNLILNLIVPGRKRRQDEQMERDILAEEAIRSPWRNVTRKFFHNPLGVIGLTGFVLVFGIVFIGSLMVPFDPFYSAGSMRNIGPGSGYMDIPDEMLQEGIKQISSGVTFSVGVSNEGRFYCWGFDSEGVLTMPEDIAKALENKKIDQAVAGDRHVLVLTEDGAVYGWGNNAFEQTTLPTDLKKLADSEGGIAKIGAGDQYSVILTKSGTLRVWGSTLPNKLNRISSKLDQQIDDFRTGSVNILAKKKNNELVILGTSGSELQTRMPEELKNGTVDILDFARVQKSGAVITTEGKLITWGSVTENMGTAPAFEGKAVQIAAGRSHMTVLTDEGKLFTFGKSEYDVLNAPGGAGYQKLFSGFYNTYALKNEHEYDAWGLNGFTLGTDDQGRDLFTRLIHGGKSTLQISFIAVVIQVLLGVFVGMISGFYGGMLDNLLMRFSEIIASFPFYPMIITLSAIIPAEASQYQRIMLVMVLLGVLNWPGIARLIRGQILAEREKDYITAARALGLKERSIIMSHIFPNIVSIVIVQATLGYAGNLLSEAGLSFLGFGVVEPYPSWGNMMNSAQATDVIEAYWWRWIFPGLAVFLTALTVNLIGDALRDALDPKSQER
ncbi:MAG: ABC transporter permease subunit [Ndongobacter sp.]|nr:ABC transporter permease subunit [Ndongobacter sp.]